MNFKFHHTSDFTRILIVAQFFLLSYLLYELTLSVYNNYEVDRHIKRFNVDNTLLEEENLKIVKEIDYVTSAAYVEKLTKQNRGLVNPGEEVVIVPKVMEEDFREFNLSDIQANKKRSSNVDDWWAFLFGREGNF